MNNDNDLKAKIVIFGGREFNNKNLFIEQVESILKEWDLSKDWIEIVEGGARGTDSLAKDYAISNNISYKEFNADWNKYGKSAGHLRNEQMAKYCEGQFGIAFWDGKSRGTKNMLTHCEKYDIKVECIIYNI